MEFEEDSKNIAVDAHRFLLRAGWPISSNEPAHMLGFDAVVCVIRHLHVYLPVELERDIANESHRILQVARKVCTSYNWGLVEKLKRTALEDLCPGAASGADGEGTTFASLIECEGLVQSFWSRAEYQLYGPRAYLRAPNGSTWEPEEPPSSPEEMAQRSLVEYDGTGDLGLHVSHLFGCFMHKIGWEIFRLARMPFAIRVLYTPSDEAGAEPKLFADLRQFVLQAKVATRSDGATNKAHFESHTQQYCLSAVVRLRARPEEPDFVRFYNANVAYLEPPSEGRVIVQDHWAVGEGGHSYMLFYLKSQDSVLSPTAEILRPDVRTEKLAIDMDLVSTTDFDATIRQPEPSPSSTPQPQHLLPKSLPHPQTGLFLSSPKSVPQSTTDLQSLPTSIECETAPQPQTGSLSLPAPAPQLNITPWFLPALTSAPQPQGSASKSLATPVKEHPSAPTEEHTAARGCVQDPTFGYDVPTKVYASETMVSGPDNSSGEATQPTQKKLPTMALSGPFIHPDRRKRLEDDISGQRKIMQSHTDEQLEPFDLTSSRAEITTDLKRQNEVSGRTSEAGIVPLQSQINEQVGEVDRLKEEQDHAQTRHAVQTGKKGIPKWAHLSEAAPVTHHLLSVTSTGIGSTGDRDVAWSDIGGTLGDRLRLFRLKVHSSSTMTDGAIALRFVSACADEAVTERLRGVISSSRIQTWYCFESVCLRGVDAEGSMIHDRCRYHAECLQVRKPIRSAPANIVCRGAKSGQSHTTHT